MKKVLFTLLVLLISISSYSQKLSNKHLCYDSNNEYYLTARLHNITNRTIVCIVVYVKYDGYIWDKYTYKPKPIIYSYKLKTNISPGYYRDFKFYPDQLQYKPIEFKIHRVIFANGTYKEF
jgi:hypothetical protein